MNNKKNYHFKLKEAELSELIILAKKNNESAFSELYNRFIGYITHIVRFKMNIKDILIAEELIQDTFTKAFTSLDSYKDNHSFGYWLKRIAINTTIDYIRKQNTESGKFHTEYGVEMMDNYIPDNSITEKIVREHKLKHLNQAINQLKWKDKRIYTMRYVDELKYREIADKLKVTVGTVKSHLWNVRQKLNNSVQNQLN